MEHCQHAKNTRSHILFKKKLFLHWKCSLDHWNTREVPSGSFFLKFLDLTLQKDEYGSDTAVCIVAQLCPTLCDSMDCSLPGSSVHGVLQARILEWVAMPAFRGPSRPRDQTWVSHMAGGSFTITSLVVRQCLHKK